jgi:hypothetical protein
MKGISMKEKHSLILAVFITQIVSSLSVRRHEPISAMRYVKYAPTKKIGTCKSETQYCGYSSLQIAEGFITSDILKSIKLVGNFQNKIIQNTWAKVNELAFKCHSSFDGKLIASLRF